VPGGAYWTVLQATSTLEGIEALGGQAGGGNGCHSRRQQEQQEMSMRTRRFRAHLSRLRAPGVVQTLALRGPGQAVRGTSLCVRLFLFLLSAATFSLRPADANQFVQLDFNVSLISNYRGTAFIELFDDRPLTRDNFLAYVNGGKYNNTLAHRLALTGSTPPVPFVLQGGGFKMLGYQDEGALGYSLYSTPEAQVDLDGNTATPNPTVNNEFSNSPPRLNAKGTLAMAQMPSNPNSATSQWFINLNNNTSLNVASPDGSGPYTVFGQVVGDGMSLIDVYATLGRYNFNQDADNNGTRDFGPFSEVPVLPSGTSILPLIVTRAHVVDYLGSGVSTPSGTLSKDTFLDTGTILTGPTALTVSDGITLGVRENYAVTQSIVNHGTLAPGLQLGAITMASYAQFVDGALAIQMRKRTDAQSQVIIEYDQLNVTGAAFLSGELNVSSLGGTWAANDTFDVVKAASITGSFTQFDLPLLSQRLVWNISRTATEFTLKVVAADFNGNGIVDMADYVVWRNNKGLASGATVAQGDADSNGAVNDLDFAIWRGNFGNIRGTSLGSGSLVSGGVPEPASGLLAIGGAIAVASSHLRLRRPCPN
jgi:cyclophilin family peptidyl-prolyl cis-trans isomerase